MEQREREQRERGAAFTRLVGLLAFILAAGVGFVGASTFRRQQNVQLPQMELGAPVARSTTTTTEAPRDTLVLPTSEETTTAPETSVPPETDPPTTVEPTVELNFSTDGSILRGGSGESRIITPGATCDGFTQSGQQDMGRSCNALLGVGDAVPLEWVNAGDTNQFELLMEDTSATEGDTWHVALTAPADGGGPPFPVDVTSDGKADLVFARRAGNDALSLDVVSVSTTDARVILHLDLPNGRARARGGKLVVWFSYGGADTLAQTTISRSGESWSHDRFQFVKASAVGESQFP